MFNNTIIVIIIIINNETDLWNVNKITSIKKHLENKISKTWHKVTEQGEEKQTGKKKVCAHLMCGERRDKEEQIKK